MWFVWMLGVFLVAVSFAVALSGRSDSLWLPVGAGSIPRDSPWNTLRHRERVGMGLWLGYLPGTFMLGQPLSVALGSEIAFLGVGLAWMAACLLVVFWCGSFRCPRCGNTFYQNWWYQGSYARKCAHCGLPKWAEVEHG
jgi:hypothetical protein